MSTTSTTPQSNCPVCGHAANRATSVKADAVPKENDITICIRCRGILVFDKTLALKKITTAQIEDIKKSDKELYQTIIYAQKNAPTLIP